MVRSATALLAVLILSGFTVVQQVATHTVVDGDTLWDLAQRYYQNPFDWRRIWEANRAQVSDPNVILPGWELAIPGREAATVAVEVQAAPAEQPEQRPAAPAPRSTANTRTIFGQDTAIMRSGVMRVASTDFAAVPRGLVMAVPWVVRQGDRPEAIGSIRSFAGGSSSTETARTYDRVRLGFTGDVPQVGTQLQTFRPEKVIDRVGQVMEPTGIVTVSEVEDGTAIAVVSREFGRVTLGDMVRPLPGYSLRVGDHPQPVTGGGQAMVMGFSGPSVLHDVGGIAFLDQGSNDGVNIGDEYEYLNPDAGADVVEGRLQVVGVGPDMASARILSMADAVFHPGVVVRLARKMR